MRDLLTISELVHDCYGRNKGGRSSSSELTFDLQGAGRERERMREINWVRSGLTFSTKADFLIFYKQFH